MFSLENSKMSEDKGKEKRPPIPPYIPKPKPKPPVKEEPDDEFSIDKLCQKTEGLSVIRENSKECPSSPFGCPMSPKWEVWLRVRVKPNKDCLIRTGK